MNRTKTRKWVEAKVQNYDGDDWGNDYDEEPDEPPAPPPTRPAALRQAGRSTTASPPVANSPFGQPSGPRGASQPAPLNPARNGGNPSGLRTPSGPPALHLQTQPIPTTPLNAPRYETLQGLGNSQAPAPSSTVSPPATVSARPEYGPAVASPPPPQSAPSQPPARFPPRKSSMSRQDRPEYSEASRQRSGSRPGSSSGAARPWMDQRSNSPNHPAPSPMNKQLPFVRPSDIYRRLDDEKEKERASVDSGRPSVDSLDGGVKSPTEQRQRTSLDRDDVSDTSRGLKQTLAPVAERRSEYGMDRLTSTPRDTPPDHAPAATPGPSPFLSGAPTHAQLEKDRRLSVSPQLPNLARMSGFGDDFFSNTPSPAATPDAQPQYFIESPHLATVRENSSSDQATPGNESTVSTQASPAAESVPHPGASSLIEGPGTAKSEHGVPTTSVTPVLPPESASTDHPSSSENHKTERSKEARPSIPGGWVSESTNIASESATPMELPDQRVGQLAPVSDTEASPATEPEASVEDLQPTTSIKHAQSLADRPNLANMSQATSEPRDNAFGAATGGHDQAVADKVTSSGANTPPRLPILPPLQTENRAVEKGQSGSREGRSPAGTPKDSPADLSAVSQGHSESNASVVLPTAPLNPRRNDSPDFDSVKPTMPPRNLTMSSVDTSSPNENDRLREDIMKSLSPSPINGGSASGSGLLGAADYSTTSPAFARESTYLSDVYDDYLGSADDKAVQDTEYMWKPPETGLDSQSQTPRPAAQNEQPKTVPNSQATPMVVAPPSLNRRFSWERGTEETTFSPTEDEPKTHPLVPALLGEPAKSPVSPMSSPNVVSERSGAPAPALHVEPDSSGTMSHQVSVVSSREPDGLGIAGLEPPSPISVMSADKSPVPPETFDDRRMSRMSQLSLAEEKELMQDPSNPTTPQPPDEEHPALTQPASEPEAERGDSRGSTGASNPAPQPNQLKLMSWREILSIPLPDVRAQKFDEVRDQFAGMDSGLSNWLQYMQTLPEHSNGATSPTNAVAAGGASENQTSPSSQQPYYQQYLNASNPSGGAPPAQQPGLVRTPTGSLLHGQQMPSGFGAPGNQVGAKSKEFLHAAGLFGNKATKSGMKLFNKGKNKLRGTGDKVFQ